MVLNIHVVFDKLICFFEQVKSADLLRVLEFKTTVTLEDAVEILRVWTKSENPFKSRYQVQLSYESMSRFYSV